MNKPTEKDAIANKPQSQVPDKGKAAKLSDNELDKVAGGIGGLGAPIPVKHR